MFEKLVWMKVKMLPHVSPASSEVRFTLKRQRERYNSREGGWERRGNTLEKEKEAHGKQSPEHVGDGWSRADGTQVKHRVGALGIR